LILAAVAQAAGFTAVELASAHRSPALAAARAAYVTLGRLESYRDTQLGVLIGRTRSRVTKLAREPFDVGVARIARTLVQEPALRARLSPLSRIPAPVREARANSPLR
jgi:hypothetical protein